MKILSITTAQSGWSAWFESPNGKSKGFFYVAMWVLVEDENGQRITSVSENDDLFLFDDSAENFCGWRLIESDDPLTKICDKVPKRFKSKKIIPTCTNMKQLNDEEESL
jgi:hypothetical protein